MNDNFENEEMISPERREEIARQNLSKIEEVNSQSQQRGSIYDKDQGNIPMPKTKPPNEFQAHNMAKGNSAEPQPKPSKKRKIKFTEKDGNEIEVDDKTPIGNFGITNPGYYFVPNKLLPSNGDFYPNGYTVAYRSANAKEIKHYGTTEQGDYPEFSAALNYMIHHCCEVNMNLRGTTTSYLDLLEFDRIYLLFCIRELSMPEGTPPFTMEHDCPCGYVNEVPITKDNINKMDWSTPIGDDPEKTLLRYFNPEKRCFDIRTKDPNNNMTLYVPTIGTVQKLLRYVKREVMKKKNINLDNVEVFKEYSKLEYLVSDHKLLQEDIKGNVSLIKKLVSDINNWSVSKMKLFVSLTDQIFEACVPTVSYTCKSCGEVNSAGVAFQEGYKSVFINVSTDISDELS